jgi:CubicO group peptidase (beta-lactamase class C family)
MTGRWIVCAAAAAVMGGPTTAPAQLAIPTTVTSDAEIRKILIERVETRRQSVGIVVGVIDSAGRRIVTYGRTGNGDTAPLDGNTIFEIGSISKVFTSLLLADVAVRGYVALNDPIAKYLPSDVRVPERARPITLRDLAMHSSGLPRLPNNMRPKDASNPWADYSVEQLYEFLSTYELPRDVGTWYEYSNYGFGLLGHLLARRAGMDYEALVKARIAAPLGMTSTGVTLSPAMRGRLAAGHDQSMQPTSNWDMPTLAGAAALRSTANDMLTFLAAFIGYTQSPLAPAMALMLLPRRPVAVVTGVGTEVALGWHVSTANGKTIVWHSGSTGGYSSFLAFDRAGRAGVVVLSNASTLAGPDDIGRHLLDTKSPLAQPRLRTEVPIATEVFDRYVGRYQLASSALLTIAREDGRFLVQASGQPAFEIYAEAEREFFLKVVDAQLTFEVGTNGRATAVVIHQQGRDQRAVRVE